ncbi:MAG: phosphate/phosphite/phosphonate ABC transporter substrate-binding protein [Gammaproteobacteria bacterium]|nr:phosphate/phosphite/phosphonate ABC transporter substrate-binding protein [Gammaproteobacteria bacterium]MDH5651703.1 phosphate/phosphite/phosphonate ABC transporter substrate-binding protein [Gammaproteobacteria bacterium]
MAGIKTLFCSLLLCLSSSCCFASEYLLGVFPHLPPRDLEKVFSPMAADLGKVINKRVMLRSSTTYEKFMDNLDKETFDIAFVQPFDYIRIADKFGYIPLATRKQKLSTVLVTKPDSNLNTVQDLKGKTIALPPKVAAVSLLLNSYLHEHNLVPGKDIRLTYHRSHLSCMQQILIGEADACGTAAPALRFFQHKMNVTLKIIAETQKIPHTLFVIHPRVPESERKKIRSRILEWGNDESGKKMLSRGRLQPFMEISDKDYDIVRKLVK